MMVDQYEAKFVKLFRFTPRLVENWEDEAKRFLNGLRSDIKGQLVPLNLKGYNELYKQVQLMEWDLIIRGQT